MNDSEATGDATTKGAAARAWGMPLALLAGLAVGMQSLGKPVHIDDALYLHIARQIVGHPLDPYSGLINWQQVSQPAYQVSISPPLLSYQFAAVIAIAGESELALHASMIPWTLAACWGLYRLSERFCAWPLEATLAVVLSPAVVVGLNLMLDVPLLAAMAVSLEATYRFANCRRWNWRWAALAVAMGAVAVLIKFAGIVLAPLALVIAFERRNARFLLAMLGPAAAYFAWQRFSQAMYGATQTAQGMSFLQRFQTDLPQMVWQRTLSMLTIVSMTFPLWLAFAARIVGTPVDVNAAGASPQRHRLTVAAWMLGPAAFAILFGPFVAVRSFLPCLPPLTWALANLVQSRTLGLGCFRAALLPTLLLSAVLQWTDWRWAAVYPQAVDAIAAKYGDSGKPIHFVGHWGWQHYCEKKGFVPWEANSYVPIANGLMLVPLRPDRQRVFPYIARLLKPIDVLEVPPHPWRITTWNRQAGIRFYGGDFGEIPWGFSSELTDRIAVCEVIGPPADAPDAALFPPERTRWVDQK